ncbi:hypothetical protein Efla_006220 [Eimeria flavescens]
MDSPRRQLPEALPLAPEPCPAQPSSPQTGPASHSILPSGQHSSSSHPSFGSHEVFEGLKYPTQDNSRSQEKVEGFLNVFAVVRSLNSLSDKDLVHFVVHHLRGDALLWWRELSESNRSQHLLDDWAGFKSALRRRVLQRNAASADTQELPYGLRQNGNARSYFTQLRQVHMRVHAVPIRYCSVWFPLM